MTCRKSRTRSALLLTVTAALIPAPRPAAADSDTPATGFPLVVEVVGADGEPAADATVALFADRAPRDSSMLVDACARDLPPPEVPIASAPTDAAGLAKFEGLATSSYRIVADAPTRARVVVRQPVARGVPAGPLRVRAGAGITLRGVARRSDGAPVAGVTVVVEPEVVPWFETDPALRFRASTDERGAWTITGLAPDSYDVWTWRPPGVLDRVATVDVRSNRSLGVDIPPGGVFRARVVAKEDGAPLPGAEIEVWDLARDDGYFRLGRGTTDASGVCALPLGRARATVSFVSFRCAGRRPWVADALDLEVKEGAVVTREFRIPRAEPLAGRVVGPDGPVAGARVCVDAGTLRPWESVLAGTTSVTDVAGRFRLDDARRAQVRLLATCDGFVPGDVYVTPGISATPEPSIRLRRPLPEELPVARRITGTVRFPNDTPAAGARVWDASSVTVSAADGSFDLGTADRHGVSVWADLGGFEGHGIPSAEAGGVIVTLERRPVIRGRVTSSLGADVTGSRVLVAEGWGARNSHPFANWTTIRGARVNGDGVWEVFLPARDTVGTQFRWQWQLKEYVVAVAFPGHAPEISPVMSMQSQTAPQVVDLVLGSGTELRGSVVTRDGKPAVGVSVEVVPFPGFGDPRPPWPPAWTPGERPRLATTSADGTFAVAHLRPGRYAVTARPAGVAMGHAVVDVPSDTGPVEVRLRD